MPSTTSHSRPASGGRPLLPAAFAVVAAICPRPSAADVPAQPASAAGVVQRDYARYDPLGVRLRSIVIFPTLSFSQAYTDNIYALQKGTGAYFYNAGVGVRAQTDWSRNLISFSAIGQADRFPGKSQEDTDEYNVDLTGRLDVGRSADVTATLTASRQTEPRTANTTTPGTHLPIQYDQQSATLAASKTLDRIKVSASGSLERYRFFNIRDDSGQLVLEDQRDYDEMLINPRIEYVVGPGIGVFVEAEAAQYDYRLSPPRVTHNRDATEASYLIGVVLQPTHLISGEAAVGYQDRWYRDASFKQFSGFNARVKLAWYVTQLLNLIVEADDYARPTGVLDAGGELVRQWRVGADYELLRNLVISTGGGVSRYSYDGLGRVDRRSQADLAVTYHFNRPLVFVLKYNFQDQHSSGRVHGNDFTANMVMFTIRVQK